MRITRIEQTKRKNRYSIYVDDAYAAEVSEDILVKYRLHKGQVIGHDFFQEVIIAEEQNKVNNYALKLLSHRSRSRQEIVQKLRLRGYDDAAIGKTMEFLEGHGYIDDEAFAEDFVRSRLSKKSHGKALIKQELYSRGVPKEVINRAVDGHMGYDEEYEIALELAEKKIRGSYRDDDKRDQYRKLGAFLQRKGFDYEVISSVLSKVIK
jgi:regulatory protein